MKRSARRIPGTPVMPAGTLAPLVAVIALMTTVLLSLEVSAAETGGRHATGTGVPVAAKLAPPLPAVTEDVMWKKYNEYGVTAYSRGSLSEAAKMFRNAFKALRKNAQPGSALSDSKDLRLATVMTNLGAVYRDMGKLDSAEQLLKSAIEIKSKQLSKSDPSLLLSLKHYAKLLRDTHRGTEADLLDSRADMIAWSKQATPEEIHLAEEWSPPRRPEPVRSLANRAPRSPGGLASPFDYDYGSSYGPWEPIDTWRPEPPRRFVDDNYGFDPREFHPRSLVFRGLSPNDPDVPTWKARVSMERRFWNPQLYPGIIGNGLPMRPGPTAGDYRGTRPASAPVVIAPWTSPTFPVRPAQGFGGPQSGGLGGFGGPCGGPAMGVPAGMPAPVRVLAPGGRWR